MKKHMDSKLSETITEQKDEAPQAGKTVSCHLKLTPEADSRLLKLQYLLQTENLKLSKTSIINHLLENLSVEYLSKDLSDIFGGKIRNDIVQVFLNSEMNDDDLKILQQMEKNNKKKPKI
ncbi:TPA: hypothetical protein MDI24_002485 [Klebsiella pneumoniae]|uniref:hypothetical protein n=1 Tax=Klebsiella pneumoniae complex TaxID=3390273 RepID=UPI000B136EB2|nr:hypothetical protein [Klebsiella pneumoniae]HBQ3759855.1 hypothetical protein [Klebsiella quasipneumoniae subsp. similipneumoniae]HCQ8667553.1 hypothetical protein [Klebsiella variicola]MCP6422273.1 hypothetical protein [Klebsiella pneumoniae]MCW0274044.1 hypothetical protein [Klebsiella pneumoniae]QMF85579.1 hypothetical protein HVY73_26790 [Klebsiella pneumoniae]